MSETQREMSGFRRRSSPCAAPVLVSMVVAWLGVACASQGAGTSESAEASSTVSGGNAAPATEVSSGEKAPADSAGSARKASAAAGSSATGAAPSSSAGSSGTGDPRGTPTAAGSGGTGNALGTQAAAGSGGAGATASSGNPAAAAGGGAGAAAGSGNPAAAAGSSGAAGSGSNTSASQPVDAAALARAMGFGANIGNTLENTTTWETGWGQPMISKAYIDGMASHGIKSVRVPVAWDTYANNGVIAADKLNRVKEVVSWIEAAGMYAIVNIHWDGGWIFNENKANAYRLTDDVKAKFASYWMQIASGFSAVGHQLILEGLNEEGRFYVNGDPNGTPDIAALNELNQLFVTTVRAQGGFNATRALLIAGFNTDINKTCVDAFSVPSDPAGAGKLFLSIHYYDPYTFTLMEDPADWGAPSATWGSDTEKKALEDQLTKLGDFSKRKNIPVILGEFAVTRGMKVMREASSRILWMESVAKACMSRGMVPVLWDTGSEIMRSDGSLSAELQTVLSHLN